MKEHEASQWWLCQRWSVCGKYCFCLGLTRVFTKRGSKCVTKWQNEASVSTQYHITRWPALLSHLLSVLCKADRGWRDFPNKDFSPKGACYYCLSYRFTPRDDTTKEGCELWPLTTDSSWTATIKCFGEEEGKTLKSSTVTSSGDYGLQQTQVYGDIN